MRPSAFNGQALTIAMWSKRSCSNLTHTLHTSALRAAD